MPDSRPCPNGRSLSCVPSSRLVGRRFPILPALSLLLALATAGAAAGIGAQERVHSTDPALRLQMYEAHVALTEASPFRNHPWQFIGPTNISGRMTDVAVVAPKGESYTIYVAGASGGVWRTNNEGVTWEPIFQHAASTSIGDVTLAPSNPDILWVGSGEANIFRSSMAGAGVYKSTDAGETWTHMGLAGTHTIPRIIVHPTNPDLVYVAASGHEWTHDEYRGLYRTTDGGGTWEKIFYIDEETGVIDLIMHPHDPETLYAATWQRIRERWNDPRNEPHYGGSAIYKSTDGGSTWAEVTDGLPAPRHRGRIGIDIARSNPEVLYAFVDNYEVAREAPEGETDAYGRPRGPVIQGATVFRSDDGGASWRRMSEPDTYMQNLSGTYGWVFGQIRVDPNDEDRIYVMGIQLHVSEDAGRTYRVLRGMHVDHHGMWIDPDNSHYIVNVNDGGVAISYDRGENWRTFYDNLPLVQFFNVAHDMGSPFRVYGSIQDHGSYRGVVDLSRGRHAIPPAPFEGAPGGEGSTHVIDPTNPDIVYSAGFYGTLQRTDMSTGQTVSVVPRPEEGELPFRGQWVAPFILSPHNPSVVYHGMNFLFRSMYRGESWERISPDLTYNDPARYGDIPFQTLFSIAESPFTFGLIYAGTDDGRVWRTDDGGASWREINRGLPYQKWVAELVASKYDEGTVYVAQNGKRDDDFLPWVWKSTDRGETWTSIVGNLPSGPVNVIKEDPKNPDLLYVGTDLGVYVSLDRGQEWHALPGGDVPTSFFHDLVIHPEEDILVAATHGRGLWALDVRPLQELTPAVLAAPVHLFVMEPVALPQGFRGAATTANIQYWAGTGAGEARVQILDAEGVAVRELMGTAQRGINAVRWDLTREGGQQAGPGGQARPARVAPGTYTVRVSVGIASAEGQLAVEAR
jgi:photosystem II stability/assembly factor-like uncharacterized protein